MIKFIKKEWTGSYVEGKMFNIQEITKPEAAKMIDENGFAGRGEEMIDDLILEGRLTGSEVSKTYMLKGGLEVGIYYDSCGKKKSAV